MEVPASVTGYSFASDGDSGTCSPLRHSFQKQQREKARWLNSGRGDDASEEGQSGGSPKAKTKVWTSVAHDRVKPLLQSLSSGVCVPSCITNCLVCASFCSWVDDVEQVGALGLRRLWDSPSDPDCRQTFLINLLQPEFKPTFASAVIQVMLSA